MSYLVANIAMKYNVLRHKEASGLKLVAALSDGKYTHLNIQHSDPACL